MHDQSSFVFLWKPFGYQPSGPAGRKPQTGKNGGRPDLRDFSSQHKQVAQVRLDCFLVVVFVEIRLYKKGFEPSHGPGGPRPNLL